MKNKMKTKTKKIIFFHFRFCFCFNFLFCFCFSISLLFSFSSSFLFLFLFLFLLLFLFSFSFLFLFFFYFSVFIIKFSYGTSRPPYRCPLKGHMICQKQPSRCVFRKICFWKYAVNLQEDTHAEVWVIYWNHTSACVFSFKFAAYFQNTFS